MNNAAPIIPSRVLVTEWVAQVWPEGTPVRVSSSDIHIAEQAALWGAAQTRAYLAQPTPPPAAAELSDEGMAEFSAWLAREMPPGTVISDPLWWASRIARAVAARVHAAQPTTSTETP